MKSVSYTVGDLKRIIRESANEFDAKVGSNVRSDNKKNNEKSYKDAEKAAKDFDGGLTSEKKGKLPEKEDGNHSTLDYNPRTEPSEDYKKRIKAQSEGYTSEMEKNNGIDKAAEFDDEGKMFDYFTKFSKESDKAKKALEDSGIQGHNLKELNKDKNNLYENMTPKRLNFKHTRFLNESQMLSRIPEEYKVNGQKIYMKDAYDNEYIVECSQSEKTGLVETNVVSYSNEKMMNEQYDRIQQLFDYTPCKDNGRLSNKERMNENQSFQELMDSIRKK